MAKKKKSLEQQEKALTKALPNYPQFKEVGLIERHQHFVYWYCHPSYSYNATRAYCKAYDLDDIDDYMSAAASASRLLKNVKIMDAVDIERKRRMESHEELADFVMQEWYKMAQADITEMLNVVGPIIMVKDISEIPQHLRSCIKTLETTSAGIKVTLHDKNKALDSLATVLGMKVERVQNVNEDYESIIDKIEKKRADAKQSNLQDGEA